MRYILIAIFLNSFCFAQLSPKQLKQLKVEVNNHVNNLRDSLGAEPLVFDGKLEKAAIHHSKYLAKINKLTHQQRSSRYRQPKDRVYYFEGKEFEKIGENILYTKPQQFPLQKKDLLKLAYEIFQQWKNSPGHYANMINPDYKFGDLGFVVKRNMVYATHVLGAKGREIPGQLSTNSFGIVEPRYFVNYGIGENVMLRLVNSFKIEGDTIVMYTHKDIAFDKIFSGNKDGIAIDLIDKNQFECDHNNELDYSPIYDGVLLKPVYKQEVLSKNRSKNEYKIVCSVGVIPESLKGKELSASIVFIKNGKFNGNRFPVNLPTAILNSISPNLKLINPPGVKLLNKGIIEIEKLSYTFNSSEIKPEIFPKILNKSQKVHSVKILSYSSIEGSSKGNHYIHSGRASSIKKHISKELKNKNVRFNTQAKENWSKMYFQLAYLNKDSLISWEKDSLRKFVLKDTIANWDSLLYTQRKSVALINYYGKLPDNYTDYDLGLMNLRNALMVNDFDLANKALYNIYHSEKLRPEIVNDEFLMEAFKKYPELVQNASAVLNKTCMFNTYNCTDFLSHWFINKDKLGKDAIDNLFQLYSKTGLYLLYGWDVASKKLSQVVHPDKIKSLIPEDTKDEVMVNLHLTFIKYYGQINKQKGVSNSFYFISDYFKTRSIDIEDEIKIGLFFNRWSMFHLTENMFLGKLDKIKESEDAIFLLLETMVHDIKYVSSKIDEVLKIAKSLNNERFCNWVNKSFQLLRLQEIKEIYCNSCR